MKNLAKKITMQYKTVGLATFFLTVKIANFCFRSLDLFYFVVNNYYEKYTTHYLCIFYYLLKHLFNLQLRKKITLFQDLKMGDV